jgi:chloramphenicol O-acetyltransferase type A
MKELNIDTWNRKQHFEHFMTLTDPFFAVTVEVDVTKTYQLAKNTNTSFFVRYLHDCMLAINSIENFKYRIIEDKICIYDEIAASSTIARPDNTYGYSYIHFSPDFDSFNKNFLKEKERIVNSKDLFPPVNSQDCIYCSALPWINFTGHKETFAGDAKDSIPRLAFGKVVKKNNSLMMPVAIAVNHALIDGHHVGLFIDEFQNNLSTN